MFEQQFEAFQQSQAAICARYDPHASSFADIWQKLEARELYVRSDHGGYILWQPTKAGSYIVNLYVAPHYRGGYGATFFDVLPAGAITAKYLLTNKPAASFFAKNGFHEFKQMNLAQPIEDQLFWQWVIKEKIIHERPNDTRRLLCLSV